MFHTRLVCPHPQLTELPWVEPRLALLPRFRHVHIAHDYGTTGALGGRDKLKYLAGIGDRHRGERTGLS